MFGRQSYLALALVLGSLSGSASGQFLLPQPLAPSQSAQLAKPTDHSYPAVGIPDSTGEPIASWTDDSGLSAPAEPSLAATADGETRVEPGRPLLEYRGSGMFGPHDYDEGDRWLDWGFVVQTEYLNNDPDIGQGNQQLFFRRLRPTITGGNGDWQGILQVDFGAGASGEESKTTVHWANFAYAGFYQTHISFGSFKPWFSRELLTSGPHLQTIERSYVGNADFGNPDYMLGLSIDKMSNSRKFAYYSSLGLQDHQQDVTQIQMRSPANAAEGANQGVLLTGRVDYYLFGQMPYDPRPTHAPAQVLYNRGDFRTDRWRMVVSSAIFGWWNDDNSNPYTSNGVSTSTTEADLSESFGVEVSGGVRGFGVSADAEYQSIQGRLIDASFTGGLYSNGASDLNKFAINGGYMLPRFVELVSSWSIVEASGFEANLQETSVGVNWYIKKYAVRFSGTYSFVDNVDGQPGNDLGVSRVLAQFVW